MREVQNRIDFLDGLRAVSIGFVLLEHATVSAYPDLASGFWKAFLTNGRVGVSIFFVISGYLITDILLRDINTSGRIGFRSFYGRRAFRLYPVLYLYVLLMVLFNVSGGLQNSWRELTSAATFTWNYLGLVAERTKDQWYLGHFWSLALEQQFYLFWPFVLSRCSRMGAAKLALALVVAMPLVRLGSYAVFPGQRGMLGMMFHTAADAVLIGCLVRMFQTELIGFFRRWHVWTRVVPASAVVILLILSPWLTSRLRGAYTLTVGMTLDALLPAAVIVFILANPTAISARLLKAPVLRHFGMISYSLYVWQQMFLGQSWIAQQIGVGAGLVLACLCAELSFHVIENPVRSLGKSLMRKRAAEPMPATRES